MKTTRWFLVLALIVGFQCYSDDGLAVTQKEEDKELRALLEAHRDTLKKVLEIERLRYLQGSRDFGGTRGLSRELVEIEIELARTQDERIKILEASLEACAAVEQMSEARLQTGTLTADALLLAKGDRLRAEIALHKARKAP
jgi:hypothetical protein